MNARLGAHEPGESMRMKPTANTNEIAVTNEQEKKPGKYAALNSFLQIAIIVPLALFIKSNTIELFKIPTGSMEPTLYGSKDMGQGFGDHLFVGRFSYGLSGILKVPFVNWRIKMPYNRIMLPGTHPPRVGDVVVFEYPGDPRIDYIKRCAGTPGDHVSISNGHLYVNSAIVTNSPAAATYVQYQNAGLLADDAWSLREAVTMIAKNRGSDSIKDAVYVNGRSYREVEHVIGAVSPDTPVHAEVRVPTNCFFMLGDNSAHSADSRYWGFVPMELIKGKALSVYLPIKRIQTVR